MHVGHVKEQFQSLHERDETLFLVVVELNVELIDLLQDRVGCLPERVPFGTLDVHLYEINMFNAFPL